MTQVHADAKVNMIEAKTLVARPVAWVAMPSAPEVVLDCGTAYLPNDDLQAAFGAFVGATVAGALVGATEFVGVFVGVFVGAPVGAFVVGATVG